MGGAEEGGKKSLSSSIQITGEFIVGKWGKQRCISVMTTKVLKDLSF